jgi:hypothetical protein
MPFQWEYIVRFGISGISILHCERSTLIPPSLGR